MRTPSRNLPSRDTPWWTADDILSIVGAPGRGVRAVSISNKMVRFVGSSCESRNARTKEEDEMAKWQRWERVVRRRSYKALPPPLAFEGFWETTP